MTAHDEAYLSPALRRPALPDSEKRRLRELSTYYCTINQPVTSEAPTGSDEAASLSSDITLTALTQLGVFKFGCMRSYVSLIDGQNQHIISEATASISLRRKERHEPDDGLHLGVTTLDLVFGVCPHAVKLFSGQDVPHLQNTANVTANSSRYIVRDFTLEEYFKDRPYVTQWPFFRFYAEVPIYSPSGHILGSYCVVDNKPRTQFGEAEVSALQEVSDAIARHIENVRTVHYHRRLNRLVQGLTTFVKHRPDDWSVPVPLRKDPELTQEADDLHVGRLSLLTEPTATSSPLPSTWEGADLSTDATSLSIAAQQFDRLEGTSETITEGNSPQTTVLGRGSPAPVTVNENIPLSKRIEALFAHASQLLRESMDVDGVLFVDACRCNSGIVRSKSDLMDWEPLPQNADPSAKGYSAYKPPSSRPKDTPCETLGQAIHLSEPGSDRDELQYTIADSLLQDLIVALPRGGVVHLDDDLGGDQLAPNAANSPGLLHSALQKNKRPSTRHLVKRLARVFPKAKSLLFIPLWDWNKGQWLAGTFVWTNDEENERSLGLDELHYFKVFGDSMISEIARLNWSSKEKSKFDLISSVSHELRSPLHGMLANAELLSTSNLRPDQQDTVKAIETCGITLLDTMNHLLDFAKINNLTTGGQGASSVTSLVSEFDLDVLVEEVVNSVFTGMRHAATATSQGLTDSESRAYKPDLSVVLRLENQDHWKVSSMTGAWRRIVMNILGNALKYTDRGFVEVSASMLKSPDDPQSVLAHLRFADSGRGMSEDFLKNRLFSPFTQEDALSEGAGLGLSIVKQLVSFLKGSIDVKSELGVGTQVDIFIPVQTVSTQATLSVPTRQGHKFCLVGLGTYPDPSEEPTGTLSAAAKRKISVQSFFTNLIESQPGWSVSFAESIDDVEGDTVIMEEKALKNIPVDTISRYIAKSKFSRLITLSDGAPSLNSSAGSQPVRLYHPFSPRKVFQVLKSTSECSGPVSGFTPPAVRAPCAELPSPSQPLVDPKVAMDLIVSETPHTQSENLNVLIVDDNEINIKVLAKLMSKLGYTHSTASNGLIALNKYKESPRSFKVVLMDVSMPVMDGIDSTRHIRAFEHEHSLPPVKVFAVTGIASAPMQQDAMLAGVDEYLVKPLSLQQVGKLLQGYL
ncbi:hypothetical protein BJX99DRAFT_223539 [Aspergillus californicus]